MKPIFEGIPRDYRERVLARWQPVLDADGGITNEEIRISTALVLENTQREGGIVNESYTGAINSLGGMGAGPSGNSNGGGTFGTDTNYGAGDSRIPSIVVPTLRRFYPELIAHEIVGVQPMNGPVGFAFAIRAKYGVNGGGVGGKDAPNGANSEIGYNYIDSTFTGTSGLATQQLSGNYMQGGTAMLPGVGATTTANAYWEAFAGADGSAASLRANGLGANLTDAEWWKIGEDMPMANFAIEKGIVEAKSRKIAANWSLELQEDLMNMHGISMDNEMVRIMGYEIKAEIDRQILGEIVKSTIVGGSDYCSHWTPVSADGRNQEERIGTLYTQILLKAQEIAIKTRRGPGNKLVVSPTVAALLERLRDFTGFFAVDQKGSNVNTNVGGQIAKIGTLRQGAIDVYRDTFAGGQYALLTYKGANNMDSGVVYCPYVPFQMMRAIGTQDFSPRIGMRTRYGILSNLYGSALYSSFIKIDGITSTVAADGGRVFTYA
jgi:hypothetical protein